MRAEAIQRYAEPITEPDEPATGACWNCGHMCDVKLKMLYHSICVVERDNGDMSGEIRECDPNTRECNAWTYHE